MTDTWEFRPIDSTKFISFATLYYMVTVNAKQVKRCHSRLLNDQDVQDLADKGIAIPDWLMQKVHSEPLQKMHELDLDSFFDVSNEKCREMLGRVA